MVQFLKGLRRFAFLFAAINLVSFGVQSTCLPVHYFQHSFDHHFSEKKLSYQQDESHCDLCGTYRSHVSTLGASFHVSVMDQVSVLKEIPFSPQVLAYVLTLPDSTGPPSIS